MSFQLAFQMKIVCQSFPCSSSVLILQQRFMNDVILFILYLRTRTQTYVHDPSLTASCSRIHHAGLTRASPFSFHCQSGTDERLIPRSNVPTIDSDLIRSETPPNSVGNNRTPTHSDRFRSDCVGILVVGNRSDFVGKFPTRSDRIPTSSDQWTLSETMRSHPDNIPIANCIQLSRVSLNHTKVA